MPSDEEVTIIAIPTVGNTGKYSVKDRPYRLDRREGQYRGQERNISRYCPPSNVIIGERARHSHCSIKIGDIYLFPT